MAKADKPEKNNKKQKHFWKDFKAELKKVIWPTRSQVINNTIIVIVIVAIVTAICFVLDLSFEALNTDGINKLKTIVQESVSNKIDDNSIEDQDDKIRIIETNEIIDEANIINDTNMIEGSKED